MLTYSLTDTGYIILLDGSAWVDCQFDPSKSGETPFDSDESKLAHIQANYPEATAA